MTCNQNLEKKARHVQVTWGKRCDKLLFVSDEANDTFPAIGVKSQPGRNHLTAKTMRAFDYIYKHHFDDADWFMKADDDTFVIMENLKSLLNGYMANEPIFFGHPLKFPPNEVYHSGGAGYVISKEALQR